MTHLGFRPELGRQYGIREIGGRSGFHEVEKGDYAWAMLREREDPSLTFHPPAGHIYLVLQFYAIFPQYPIAEIDVRLNDVIVETTKRWREAGWFELLVPPFKFEEKQSYTLSLNPPVWWQGRLFGEKNMDDRRYLSIGLGAMKLDVPVPEVQIAEAREVVQKLARKVS